MIDWGNWLFNDGGWILVLFVGMIIGILSSDLIYWLKQIKEKQE